jgi:hypothetical protein
MVSASDVGVGAKALVLPSEELPGSRAIIEPWMNLWFRTN